ncbi:MAG: T9SS type A sorting domain-containing protein [Bacteroidota bacterium]
MVKIGTTLFAGHVGSAGHGVYSSTDGGSTWAQTGLTLGSVYSIAASGTTLFAVTSGQGVQSSVDNGVTWTNQSASVTQLNNARSIAVIGTNIFAGSYSNGPLYYRPLSDITTGVEELNGNEEIGVYPNPSQGRFELTIKNTPSVNGNLEIVNVLGEKVQVVTNVNLANYSINISNQPKGVYFLNVNLNGKVYTKKIVVE